MTDPSAIDRPVEQKIVDTGDPSWASIAVAAFATAVIIYFTWFGGAFS